MVFEFLHPVWSGERLRCEMRIEEATQTARRVRVRIAGICTNELGMEVLRFHSNGLILAK
jgi:acyl dehydratase